MKLSHLCTCITATLTSLSVLSTETPTKEPPADLEKIEVLGHKLSTINHDLASSVSSLSIESIERQQAAELEQILKTLPSVEFVGSSAPLSGQPSIRGFHGERIYISVDGVKRKTDSDGSQNIAQINSLGVNPDQLKQVQVLRGADSLTVGSGAIGGSIRLVTKDASDYLADQMGMGARVSAGLETVSDAQNYNVDLFHLNTKSDTVLSLGYVQYEDIDIVGKEGNDVEDTAKLNSIKNSSNRQNIMLKNTLTFNNQHQLKSKIDYSITESDDQPYNQRLDYGLAYPTLSQDYENDFLEGTLKYSFISSSNLVDLDIQAFFSEKTYDKVTNGYIVRGGNQYSYEGYNKGKSQNKGLRFSNLATFDGLIDHKVAIEMQYDEERFQQENWDEDTQNLTSFYGNSEANNWSFSVIDQSEFFDQRVLLTLGVRLDSYDRSSDFFDSFDSNQGDELSHEASVTFKATKNINLYLKSAEAFRAPSLQELYKKDEWRCHVGGKICYQEPQPDLKPEESENLEFGIGFSWQDLKYAENLSLKLMYFDNEIHNYIDNVPFMYYIDENGAKQLGAPYEGYNDVPVATHRDYSAKNIGKYLSHGIELEANYSYGDVDMYLGYSSINIDVSGTPDFFLGTTDNTLQPYADAPADKITWNTNYQVTNDLNIGFQLLHYRDQQRLSQTYLDYGYGTSTYTIYNLNAKYAPSEFLQGLTIRLGIDNAADKRYFRAPAIEANDPSESARNIKLTVAYQL